MQAQPLASDREKMQGRKVQAGHSHGHRMPSAILYQLDKSAEALDITEPLFP